MGLNEVVDQALGQEVVRDRRLLLAPHHLIQLLYLLEKLLVLHFLFLHRNVEIDDWWVGNGLDLFVLSSTCGGGRLRDLHELGCREIRLVCSHQLARVSRRLTRIGAFLRLLRENDSFQIRLRHACQILVH